MSERTEGQREVTRDCAHCKSSFTHTITGRGSTPLTCSRSCKMARDRAREAARRVRAELPLCVIDRCHRKRKSFNNSYCETHYYRIRRHGDTHITLNRQPNGVCHHCGADAPINQLFCSVQCQRRNRVGAPGRASTCITCGGAISRPFATIYCGERCQRLAARGRLYGLPADQLHGLLASGGGCAICGRTDRKLHIDHCHTTGRVRGLLCSGCNTALGKFRDSERILLSAVEYLRRTDGLGGQHSSRPASA